MKERIYVTQPTLPKLEEFIPILEDIWKSKWLTNNGKYHIELESQIAKYLGVPYISLFTNGTLALITALQCLRISGEVITTPYSFVATTHALHWNNINPVFCDVEPDYLNLDPNKIEALITPRTTAILPVHVYGNPCYIDKIQEIADNYGLKVIYDAAHAFGVKKQGNSILNFGDLSILSFHATKVFNTIEGGAIVSHDLKTKQSIDNLKNFGFVDETTVIGPGINAKMNELQAAFGLLQLRNIDDAIENRKIVASKYRYLLKNVSGISILNEVEDVKYNYSHFPIFVNNNYKFSRDELYKKLKDNNIYARRYFYPLISDFPTYSGLQSALHSNLPVAVKAANEVICLPIYPELNEDIIEYITRLI